MKKLAWLLGMSILLVFPLGCIPVLYPKGGDSSVLPDFSNDKDMGQFIEGVYQEPYFLLTNNCIHKSIKIARKARELEKDARIIVCWSIVPMKIYRGFPSIQPHMYAEVQGQRVDVSLDPGHEERYCKNSEKIIIFPIKLPRLR